MKTIDVRKQPKLGFSRIFRMTVIGIRYRLFRSFVSVMVIAVAVAFLMNILAESLAKRSMAMATREQIREMRLAPRWVSRLSLSGTVESVLREVASTDPQSPLFAEIRAMGGFDEAAMGAFQKQAQQAVRYLDFFEELSYGQRRRLVHSATGTEIFARLQDPAHMEAFLLGLKSLRSVRFLTTVERFQAFLKNWPQMRQQSQRVLAGRKAAQASLATALAGRSVLEALTEADGAFGAAVRKAGFHLPPADARTVSRQAGELLSMRQVEKSMRDRVVRREAASRFNVSPVAVNATMLWPLLADPETAAWYVALLRDAEAKVPGLTAERLIALSRLKEEMQSLAQAERLQVAAGGGLYGLGERITWLLLISMVVCMVGIANAMLMTVTERFREIATLKCLGALDGYIMLTFVIEASILGLVGGLIGAAAGTAIGVGRMAVSYGGLLIASLEGGAILAAMGISVVLGVVLAALASVYPSMKAARLAPMEAMRVE